MYDFLSLWALKWARQTLLWVNLFSSIITEGTIVLGDIWAFLLKYLALRKMLRNLHTKSRLSSFCSFRDLSVRPDEQTDGHGFLLPVTYFPTNLVYHFTLRVTGIIRKNVLVECLDYQISVTQLNRAKGRWSCTPTYLHLPPKRDLKIW